MRDCHRTRPEPEEQTEIASYACAATTDHPVVSIVIRRDDLYHALVKQAENIMREVEKDAVIRIGVYRKLHSKRRPLFLAEEWQKRG